MSWTSRNSCSQATHIVYSRKLRSRVTFWRWDRQNKENEWYLAEAVRTKICFAKKVLWNIRQNHRKTSLAESCLGCRPPTLVKEILMNNLFSVNGCKHLWTAAFDLGKHLTTLTIIFDSAENIWNFSLWSSMMLLGKVVF